MKTVPALKRSLLAIVAVVLTTIAASSCASSKRYGCPGGLNHSGGYSSR